MQGLAPKIVERLVQAVNEIRKETAVLMVEQNADLALDLADRVYIMRDGHIVFSGLPNDVRENENIKAYLVIS
jgi:branched-chain amino acid transport system ATP-binding protein